MDKRPSTANCTNFSGKRVSLTTLHVWSNPVDDIVYGVIAPAELNEADICAELISYADKSGLSGELLIKEMCKTNGWILVF